MVDWGRGAIINMSSTAGFQPLPYNAGYAAAKGFLLLLSEAVHAEVQDRDALDAADRGRIPVIPRGPHVRAAFGPNRKLPRWLILPVSERLMARR